MNLGPYAKALYACLMAGLTAAAAIFVGNVWLVIVLAALTPLGVYAVANRPANPVVGPLDKGSAIL